MADFLEMMGAIKVTTTAYKPSSNGSIEGFHAYLAKALTSLVEDQHDTWDQHLGSVLFAYRTTPMDGLDITPFEVLFGREANLPIDTILRRENLQEPVTTQQQHIQMIRERALATNAEVREKRRERFERNRRAMANTRRLEFTPGDKIDLAFQKADLGRKEERRNYHEEMMVRTP